MKKAGPKKSITVSIRMPAALSAWLDKKATQNRRSKSSEIILMLEEKKADTG